MQRIVILGGGVGGTLTANLSPARLQRRSARRGRRDPRRRHRRHVYQPGFMYIAMGGEREERLSRPERALLDRRRGLMVDSVDPRRHGARTGAVWRAARPCRTTTS